MISIDKLPQFLSLLAQLMSRYTIVMIGIVTTLVFFLFPELRNDPNVINAIAWFEKIMKTGYNAFSFCVTHSSDVQAFGQCFAQQVGLM
jgi:hypothetical protein